ncbi:MAG: YihY/virulence factor BrkB family protein, partial [Bdellovibrionales bacterium]|nr:YihY/virulence factor BrkB family protein [Bdellovibrionales bacterium]
MSKISNIEDKMIQGTNQVAQKLVSTLISAFTDYKHRHLGLSAASVSFYVIFSVFPLLAFSVYLVSKMIGDANNAVSAPMVVTTLRDFVPGMQNWIEKGLFDVVKGTAMSSWMNAILLGWSGVGLFAALLNAMNGIPNDHEHHHRAHTTQFVLAAAMLGLFAAFVSTLMFTEIVNAAEALPYWMEKWPSGLKMFFYYAAKTKILLALVSVGFVMGTYMLLCPVRLKVKSAFIGALVF